MTAEALSAAEGPPRMVPDRDAADIAVARQSVVDIVAARLVQAPPYDHGPPDGGTAGPPVNGSGPTDADRPGVAPEHAEHADAAPADAPPGPDPAHAELDQAERADADRADAELAHTEPVDAELAHAEPVEAEAAYGQAADAEPVDAGPVDAELADAGPVDAELADAVEADVVDAGPVEAELADAEVVDAGPVGAVDPVDTVAGVLAPADGAEDPDPPRFAATAVLDVLRATGWADAEEARGLRAEADRLRELLDLVVRDHRAREATAAGLESQQGYWLVPLLRAAHGVAFGSLGAKVALRTAVQEVPEHILHNAGLRIDYGVEPQDAYDS